ncbi:MAG: hypothetical protein NPIRA04_18630 [Nitrospirales bacterium]|nr:MAG: hypothetical protein NPIRA04_18630 [Nitrospirales bacterium]
MKDVRMNARAQIEAEFTSKQVEKPKERRNKHKQCKEGEKVITGKSRKNYKDHEKDMPYD